MFIDLKLEQNREMLCFEAILASISVYLNRRYEMIFSQMWNFKLNEADIQCPGFIGGRVSCDRGNPLELLEKFHGIRGKKYFTNSGEEVLDMAIKQLEIGMPLATNIKGNCLSYVPEVVKDQLYPFIIVGIDNLDHCVLCLDIQSLQKVITLPVEVFINSCINYHTFSIVGEEQENLNWISIIQERTDQLLLNNSFISMREFAMLVENCFDYNVENTREKDWEETEICKKLKILHRSRFLFAVTIDYFVNYHNASVIKGYSDKFMNLSNKWGSIWGVFMKVFFKRNTNFETQMISKKILGIADEEENLCQELINVLKGNVTFQIEPSAIEDDHSIQNFVFVSE